MVDIRNCFTNSSVDKAKGCPFVAEELREDYSANVEEIEFLLNAIEGVVGPKTDWYLKKSEPGTARGNVNTWAGLRSLGPAIEECRRKLLSLYLISETNILEIGPFPASCKSGFSLCP